VSYPDDIGPGPYPIRYIGGPNDGTKERRDDLPEHIGIGTGNGQVANYNLRGFSDGNGTINWTYQYVNTN